MTVRRRTAVALLAAGAWTVLVWLVFLTNLDPAGRSAGFLLVHRVLAVANVALGAWLALLGGRLLARGRRDRVPGSAP